MVLLRMLPLVLSLPLPLLVIEETVTWLPPRPRSYGPSLSLVPAAALPVAPEKAKASLLCKPPGRRRRVAASREKAGKTRKNIMQYIKTTSTSFAGALYLPHP